MHTATAGIKENEVRFDWSDGGNVSGRRARLFDGKGELVNLPVRRCNIDTGEVEFLVLVDGSPVPNEDRTAPREAKATLPAPLLIEWVDDVDDAKV